MLTEREAIDKAEDIIADHWWDGEDGDLMIEMGKLIEEIYKEIGDALSA